MEDSPEDKHHRELLKEWCKNNSSDTKKILEELNEPLKDGVWRYDDKNILCTHHNLSGGNFHIKDEKLDEFLEFYADSLIGNNLGICESVHGQEHKFFMDLDYRKLPEALTDSDIINHGKAIVKIVSEYDNRKRIKDDLLKAAIFLNDPQFVDGFWKAGCHIVFQNFITDRQYSIGLNQFISEKMQKLFPNFNWDSIIEKKLEDLRMPYSGKVKSKSFYKLLCIVDENGLVSQESDMRKIIKMASIRSKKGVILTKGYLCRIPRESIPYDSWGDKLLNFINENIAPLSDSSKIVNIEEIISGRSWSHLKLEISNMKSCPICLNSHNLVCDISVGGSLRVKCDSNLEKPPRTKIPESISSLIFDPLLIKAPKA